MLVNILVGLAVMMIAQKVASRRMKPKPDAKNEPHVGRVITYSLGTEEQSRVMPVFCHKFPAGRLMSIEGRIADPQEG